MCAAGRAPSGRGHTRLAPLGLFLAAASVIFADTLLAQSNQPPTAALVASPNQGHEPLAVVLDGRGSSDPDGYFVSYHFDFGDGTATTSAVPVVTHTYRAGTWRATVTATDNRGATATAGVDVRVISSGNQPPPPAPGTHGPQELVALLKWCWENRDANKYRELFTDDFRFTFVGDSSGTIWDRNAEVAATTSLFGSGTATQPGATGIALIYQGNWAAGTLDLTGKPYPWHQQVWVPHVWFQLSRSDGSTITTEGGTLFYLVRGDSAAIPQELLDRGFTRDSTRWYVEAWEDTPRWWPVVDHAPVVTAPESVQRTVNVPVAFQITAGDPDGEAIESLRAEGPSGISFEVAADKSSGILRWTPTSADVGSHTVDFVAANRLWGAAQTVLTIRAPNQPPTAALTASPTQGTAPLQVVLDASGSSDADGRVVSYRFNFGDGPAVTVTNPVVSHTYQAGTWRATVTVTDDAGTTASAGVDLLVTAAENRPPTAALVATPSQGTAPLSVVLDARGSSDPDGNIVSYRFDFGDGASVTGANPVASHTYQAGTWRATVIVTDAAADTASAGVNLLVTAAENRPPTAALVATPAQGTAPLSVVLDARGSADPDGNIVSYRFDFGDGASVTGANPIASHTYQTGAWRATVTVTDGNGATATAGVDVLVGENRPPTAALVASPAQGAEPLVVALDARGSSDPDANIASYRFDFGDGTATTSSNPVVSHTYWAGSWRATVTVKDAHGATAGAGVDLTVTPTNLATNPSFESDAGGWITDGEAVLARIEGGHDGLHALQISGGPAIQSHFGINDWPNAISQTTGAGLRLRFTAWVRSPSAQGTAKLLIREYSNVSGARLGEVFSVPSRLTPEWQMLTVDYVTAAENSYLSFQVRDYPVAPGEVFVTDEITVKVVGVGGALPNLAQNPSFEIDAQGWKTDGDATLERVPGGAEGGYALRVTGSAAMQAHFGINDFPNIVYRTTSPGIRYRFTAWVRSPSAQGTAKLMVREYAGTVRRGEVFSLPVPLTPDWQMMTLDYVTRAANNTLSFQVRDYPVAPSEEFLIDDITVRAVAVESVQPNLCQNPSFEIDIQGWKTDGEATLVKVPGGQEGEYALQVTGSAATQAHFGINDSPNTVYRTIEAGTVYRATAWVRSPSAGGTAKLLIREYGMSTAGLLGEVFSDPVQLAPEWQVLTLDYATTAGNTTLSFQVRDYPVAPAEVFLTDGISIRNLTGRDGASGMSSGPAWVDEDSGFHPLLAPNPVRDQGWLRFATREAGPLRVEVLDVAGRRVRRILDEAQAPAGVHELLLPRTGDHGQRLVAGIYFYRIEAQEGVKTGRFVVLE